MKQITETAEWKQLQDYSFLITNAVLSDDEVLEQHYWEGMKRVGDMLFTIYGRDPVVLETLADFAPEISESKELYHEAIHVIDTVGGDSTSARISLAELVLQHGSDAKHVATLTNGIDQAHLCSRDKDRLLAIRSWIDSSDRSKRSGLVDE